MDQMTPVTHVRNAVQWSGAAALITPEPWVADAACAEIDPEWWFPEKGCSPEPARAICLACPVMDECLAFALRTGQTSGVWGGKTERQIAKMRRKDTAA